MRVTYLGISNCSISTTTDDTGKIVYTLYTPLHCKLDDQFCIEHDFKPHPTVNRYLKVLSEEEFCELKQFSTAEQQSNSCEMDAKLSVILCWITIFLTVFGLCSIGLVFLGDVMFLFLPALSSLFASLICSILAAHYDKTNVAAKILLGLHGLLVAIIVGFIFYIYYTCSTCDWDCENFW